MSLPTPDFLRPVRGRPLLAWVFLATTAAVLAVVATDAWSAWQTREDTQASVVLLQQTGRSQAPPVPRAEQAALIPLQALLDAPWRQRLEAIESSTPAGIAWLAIDLAHGGDLQLVGVAPDSAAALHTADRLRAAGPWAGVVVTRIEPGADRSQRFELRGTAPGQARDPARVATR